MTFEKTVQTLESFTRRWSSHLEVLGVFGILTMFLVNLVDVVGAKLFMWPLPGSIEIISFSQIVAIAPTIAFSLILGRHIRVEFIVSRLPFRIRAVIGAISSFLSLALFLLLLWQSYLYGLSLQKAGEIGSTSHLPFYPFAYLIAFCSMPVSLVFGLEMLKSLIEATRHGPRP